MSQTQNTLENKSIHKKSFSMLLAALGVVFGDIGTSPLYALKESFHPAHGMALTHVNIFGILSLVFWSLTLVISLKYVTFILKADNHGEGGASALMALVLPVLKTSFSLKFLTILGLLGVGLLLGDSAITPAISVLSAVEGLQIAAPGLHSFVIPITILILLGLFSVQKKGTAKIGSVFGIVMLIWFITIAAIGIPWIFVRPDILYSLNPYYALQFFIENQWHGFFILSSVVLCITGGEALYADLGHFGRSPIIRSWYFIVFPSLMLNYLGQGALVLEKGDAVLQNTFYGLVSGFWIYPLIVIATCATVIASQALISGVFSLTQQTQLLGFLPRVSILHTSRETEGQIYIPKANLFLMLACIWLVLTFKESGNLTAAYGIAVTGTMAVTSIFFYYISRRLWHWSFLKSFTLVGIFLIIDLSFFISNVPKITTGGWFPLAVAAAMITLMLTWKKGRDILSQKMREKASSLDSFIQKVAHENPHRLKGTSVFMTLNSGIAPSTLIQHYKHNKVLREKIILLSIINEHAPDITPLNRLQITHLPQGFHKVIARYGYMQTPNVEEILNLCKLNGLEFDDKNLNYYLGRELFVTTGDSSLKNWQKGLFIFLTKNSRSAAEFFKLPQEQVIEIGSQIEI